MKVWKISEDVNVYAALNLVDSSTVLAFSKQFGKGVSLMSNWESVKVELYDDDGKKKKGDIFYLTTSIHIFNEKGFNCIRGFIEKDKSEFLELYDEFEKYYLLNVFNLVDCIDLEKSEVVYFPNSTRVLSIDKYVFKKEKVIDEPIFKSTTQPRGPIFISEKVKSAIGEAGLEGLKFELVWDSEE